MSGKHRGVDLVRCRPHTTRLLRDKIKDHFINKTRDNLSGFTHTACRDVEQGRGWTSAPAPARWRWSAAPTGNWMRGSSGSTDLRGGWVWADASGWVDWQGR